MTVSTVEELLPGGLVLRPAGPGDLAQIGTLLVDRGEDADALDHRLVMADPDAGWESCAVVTDADRVVSTATLLDEQVRVGSVMVPAGQVELVATAKGYEGRGLVRALMAWAHRRSAERGQVVQVMVGIPYFYRLFGYEYAIDIPQPRLVATPTADGPPNPAVSLRPASLEDVDALCALQRVAQATADVAMPHPPARTRWLVQHASSTTWVLDRGGEVVASARVPVDTPEADLFAAEVAARDESAALGLLSGLQASAGSRKLEVVDRPGTVTDQVWSTQLSPAEDDEARQYYVRIPDPATLLDRLRPVLDKRLALLSADELPGSAIDGASEVVLSTFGRHYRLPIGADGLGAVVGGGPLQAPGAVGGAGVAPDALGALLFGQRGIAGLTRQRPDVYPGPNRALFEALFPAQTADLLTYYLPY